MKHDDPIERLLLNQFEGSVPDDGFSDRVMQRLPARRRHVAWPLWAGLLTGAGMCGLSVAGLPWTQIVWHDLTDGGLSVSTAVLMLVTAGMSALACWWGIAEADNDDR